jgi:endonuclease YncB( thermonuclease family)
VALLLSFSCRAASELQNFDTAHVVAVRDGDTIELSDGRVVRYVGINTPEIGQPGADSATVLNKRLVLERTVRLEYGRDRIDRYGRTLAIVYVGETMVSRALLDAGWGWCYFYNGNLRHGAELVRALRRAMEAKRGIWSVPTDETEESYLGSFRGFRFHRPDCESVRSIELQNEVSFPAKDSAFYDGYSPCAVCRP